MPKDKNPQTEEFANMIQLLSVYSEGCNRLEQLQAEINEQQLELVDEHKAEYTDLQRTLTETEAALETIARKHPEWFTSRKSIKTMFGTVKLTSSSKLQIPNEDVTILLLEQEAERQRLEREKNPKAEFLFDAAAFLRTRKEPDLEALEKCDDATLARFRISRVKSDSFSVQPAKMDLGKAVKESTAEATAA